VLEVDYGTSGPW